MLLLSRFFLSSLLTLSCMKRCWGMTHPWSGQAMWQKSHQPLQLLVCSFEVQSILGLQFQPRGEVAQLNAERKQAALSRGV